MSRSPSPLHLEQQRVGERPVDARDADAVAALVANDAALLERLPPAMMAARIRAELQKPSSSSSPQPRWWVVAPAFAVVAVVGVNTSVVDTPLDRAVSQQVRDDVEVTRLKGLMPALDLQKQIGATTTPLSTGAVVEPGDIVQVRTRAAGKRHGVVISVDGRGGVTRHFPDDDDTTLPTGTAALPFSFELDDAPAFERFFLVTADGPIDVGVVEAAAAALVKLPTPDTAALAVPTSLTWTDFLLRKR